MKEIKTSIWVSVSTKERLRQLKGKHETWDMLINRLIDNVVDCYSGEMCFECGEKLVDVVSKVDFRKSPIAVMWFDEGSSGGKYEPSEPAGVYFECWNCFMRRWKDEGE